MSLRLCALFFASGAAALSFETLWFRQAALALGSGVWASSLVLAGFMAGLGLGNGLAARLGDRLARPLRAFAALEAVVGLTGLALVYGLPRLAPALAAGLAPLEDTPWLRDALRLVAAFALLLVPSTAMGLTLPLLARQLAPAGGFGAALGRLYGWNTLGAVCGAAACEAWAIGALGVRGAAWATAGIEGLVALAALGLARAPGPGALPAPPEAALPERIEPAARRFLAATFVAGFALLALEVIWFRFLALFVVTHDEAFAWMLCTVLAAIGAGGLAAGEWLRRRDDAHRGAAPAAFVAGLACVASYALFPTPEAAEEFRRDGAAAILALCVPLMAPTAFLSGALFPWIGAALRRARPSAASAAGALSLANTAGAALGALAGGFVLLPALGMERSLFALAASYGLVGLALAPSAPRRTTLAAGAALLAGLALFPFGAMERRHFRHALALYESGDDTRLRIREGVNETILWIERRFLGEPWYQRMVTNSFSMSATDVHSRRYMKLFAWWPLAVHPHPRDALLISYGVGSTAKALTDAAALERIDVVELSPDVVAMSEAAFAPGESPLADPRVRLHLEDGRWFLLGRDRRWDLITSEPPPPQLAGVVGLYTREYFALLRAHLREGGVVTYWLPIRQLSDAATKSVVRAFCDVFDDCSLWRGSSFDLMLVGTRGLSGPVSEEHFTALWRDPAARPELEALGVERPEQLGALFLLGPDDLKRDVADAAPVTDDRPKRITAPVTSREAQARLYAGWLDPDAARRRFLRSRLVRRLWPADFVTRSAPYFELAHLLDTFGQDVRRGLWSERLGDLEAVLSQSGARAPALWLLDSDADLQRIVASRAGAARDDPAARLQLGIGRLAARDYAGAAEAFALAERDAAHFDRAFPLRLFALCMAGRVDEARALARERGDDLGRGPLAGDYWAWMEAAFGVTPRQEL